MYVGFAILTPDQPLDANKAGRAISLATVVKVLSGNPLVNDLQDKTTVSAFHNWSMKYRAILRNWRRRAR